MNDNNKLRNWLESLPNEKYQQVINEVFLDIPNKEETLISWFNDNQKIWLYNV